MELTVPPHLRKTRHPPAPRCDPGTVQAPEAPQQVTIDVGEPRADLGGLEGKVPFDGADTAAFEVNPPNALSGKDSVAVVRLAVESLAVEVDSGFWTTDVAGTSAPIGLRWTTMATKRAAMSPCSARAER